MSRRHGQGGEGPPGDREGSHEVRKVRPEIEKVRTGPGRPTQNREVSYGAGKVLTQDGECLDRTGTSGQRVLAHSSTVVLRIEAGREHSCQKAAKTGGAFRQKTAEPEASFPAGTFIGLP